MILSVSRRTDIPVLYSEWFINRLREGNVLVPNPYNTKQLSQVMFSAETIDCIVFWTKDASPVVNKLGSIEEIMIPKIMKSFKDHQLPIIYED